VDESPRYLVFAVIPSMFSKLKVLLTHTGSGAQDSREKDERGSQPPKQYAPTPHCPYSTNCRQWRIPAGLRLEKRTYESSMERRRGTYLPDRTRSARRRPTPPPAPRTELRFEP
jgi:hypothetical protein